MSHARGEKCHVEPIRKPVDPAALEAASVTVLSVAGMGCANCVVRVRNSLLRQPGVLRAEVELADGRAWVHFDAGRIRVDDLLEAVAAAAEDGRHEYRAWVLSQARS